MQNLDLGKVVCAGLLELGRRVGNNVGFLRSDFCHLESDRQNNDCLVLTELFGLKNIYTLADG